MFHLYSAFHQCGGPRWGRDIYKDLNASGQSSALTSCSVSSPSHPSLHDTQWFFSEQKQLPALVLKDNQTLKPKGMLLRLFLVFIWHALLFVIKWLFTGPSVFCEPCVSRLMENWSAWCDVCIRFTIFSVFIMRDRNESGWSKAPLWGAGVKADACNHKMDFL